MVLGDRPRRAIHWTQRNSPVLARIQPRQVDRLAAGLDRRQPDRRSFCRDDRVRCSTRRVPREARYPGPVWSSDFECPIWCGSGVEHGEREFIFLLVRENLRIASGIEGRAGSKTPRSLRRSSTKPGRHLAAGPEFSGSRRANLAACALLGYREHDLLGSIRAAMHPDYVVCELSSATPDGVPAGLRRAGVGAGPTAARSRGAHRLVNRGWRRARKRRRLAPLSLG